MKFREKAAHGLVGTGSVLLHSNHGEWREKFYYREYEDRLAIWRADWKNLTWEEVQAVKEVLWPGRVCVEIYPAEKDVVNLRPTRHLWYTPGLEFMVDAECRHPEFEKE